MPGRGGAWVNPSVPRPGWPDNARGLWGFEPQRRASSDARRAEAHARGTAGSAWRRRSGGRERSAGEGRWRTLGGHGPLPGLCPDHRTGRADLCRLRSPDGCGGCGTDPGRLDHRASRRSREAGASDRARAGIGADAPRHRRRRPLPHRRPGRPRRHGRGLPRRRPQARPGGALKFLLPEIEHDRDRLARLLDEVRIARQIAHPHVGRVHDVGEAGGRHLLSMEFVDGEDLATLLRRIGRLPPDAWVIFRRSAPAPVSSASGAR